MNTGSLDKSVDMYADRGSEGGCSVYGLAS